MPCRLFKLDKLLFKIILTKLYTYVRYDVFWSFGRTGVVAGPLYFFTEKCELNRKLNVFCPQSMKMALS